MSDVHDLRAQQATSTVVRGARLARREPPVDLAHGRPRAVPRACSPRRRRGARVAAAASCTRRAAHGGRIAARGAARLAALARAVVDDRSDYLDDAPAHVVPDDTRRRADAARSPTSPRSSRSPTRLPIFAGGLGAIAGEQLKSVERARRAPASASASSTGSRRTSGSTRDGVQHESWEVLDPSALPVRCVAGARRRAGARGASAVPRPRRRRADLARAGRPHVAVPARHRRGRQRVRRPRDHRAALRRRPRDAASSRSSSSGIGGLPRARTLRPSSPNVLHLNEGHTAFAALAAASPAGAAHRLTFDEAAAIAAAQMVFTTHTPVTAGHDYFPPAARRPATSRRTPSCSGIELEALLALGRYRPEDPTDTFCPTVLALRLADARNGVSRLHGAVTRQQWGGLWPRAARSTRSRSATSPTACTCSRGSPRRSTGSWTASSATSGARCPASRSPGRRCSMRTTSSCGSASCVARARLVDATRARRLLAHRAGGARTRVALDEAQRPPRPRGVHHRVRRPLRRLQASDLVPPAIPSGSRASWSDPDRPVQIVFAGKAHPNDEHGKRLLRDGRRTSRRSAGLTRRLVFIEDFDLTADRALSQGVDLWLNTPRRPARGVRDRRHEGGGQRRAQPQHPRRVVGRGVERRGARRPADRLVHRHGGAPSTTTTLQDELDAASLYDQLEHDIVAAVLRPRRARHPHAVARLGPPVDGDARRDLAIPPDGASSTSTTTTFRRGPRRAAADERRDARATARRPRSSEWSRSPGRRWRVEVATLSRSSTA